MEDVGQRRLDQVPAGDALDGLGQLRRQPVELVLHQDSLEGLKERGEGGVRRDLEPPSHTALEQGSAPGEQSQVCFQNLIMDMNLSWEEVCVGGIC